MSVVPQSLMKSHTSISGAKWSTKQIVIGFITALLDITIFDKAIHVMRTDPNLFAVLMTVVLIITAIVFFCIKDEVSMYKAGNILDFTMRYITRSDLIQKHNIATSDQKLDDHVKVKKFDEETGAIWFEKCKTYKNNTCNVGFALVVNPSHVDDLDSYNENTALLLYSLRPGIIQKVHAIQSKDVENITRQYEIALENPKLSPAERTGIYSTMRFLDNLSERVNWMYFIFIGVGYHTNEERALKDVKRVSKAYETFLNDSGVESRMITSQKEYVIVYRQMFSMKNLGVVTVTQYHNPVMNVKVKITRFCNWLQSM
jgi:hypothetical protein